MRKAMTSACDKARQGRGREFPLFIFFLEAICVETHCFFYLPLSHRGELLVKWNSPKRILMVQHQEIP